MQTSKTESSRGFDAVVESRRWKEIVATEIASMCIPERMSWFRRQSSVATIRNEALPDMGGWCCARNRPPMGPKKHD